MPNSDNTKDSRSRAALKGAETQRRHEQERRTESLEDIRSQIADGTLVVRQMTAAQRKAATKAAGRARARNEAGVAFNKRRYNRES